MPKRDRCGSRGPARSAPRAETSRTRRRGRRRSRPGRGPQQQLRRCPRRVHSNPQKSPERAATFRGRAGRARRGRAGVGGGPYAACRSSVQAARHGTLCKRPGICPATAAGRAQAHAAWDTDFMKVFPGLASGRRPRPGRSSLPRPYRGRPGAGQARRGHRRLQPPQALRSSRTRQRQRLLRKSNILLIGPTGCGKTHIARTSPRSSTSRSPSPTPPSTPRPATTARTSR